MKRIVTIARQYGSGGREIGQLAANKLKVKCYDQTLIDLTAKVSGFDSKIIESIDEKIKSNFFVPIQIAHYVNVEIGSYDLTLQDKVFLVQSEIIKQIAARESAVIVGRCSDYVLSDRDDVLKVFIYANKDFRVEKIAERHYLDEKSALKMINKTDKKRASYYRYFTGNVWGDMLNYDLVLNSGMGYDKVAQIIASTMQKD